ncbi:RNA polymerase sigma factor (sigma-70 family) [Streptomyces sp. 3330]|uniref:sigma-70 family RNA polymerase sigma factor n=1 Tax=Streptomyces sp. 3330 TaxID=2817755 RepID=UPI00285F150D|nr:sigma-70 family RNA polymerase sigma factor [Streptomyces sp. 3330]MDR6974111.1 RNA polymerase sigma factor (sigma-70 family) [Streptomyces sp. 3330]
MSTRHTVEAVALVTAARSGDQAAQDALVGAYLPLVYNIVGRALNGSVDVDDVVQDTMLRALDSLGSLRDPASFRSWLVAIAMNQVRAHWNRQQPVQGAMEEADEVADPGADFVDLTIVQLQLSGQRQETARATRWLEPDDRGLLSLWWLECAGELTRAEIAAAMDLTPEHTAVRVQRMKAQLEAARVVVRALDSRPQCPELRGALGGWDGRPSALWRKRVARHARGCARCSGLWSGLMPAEGLLAGLALVAASSALLARTNSATDTLAVVGSAAPLAGSADLGGAVPAVTRRAAKDRTTSRVDARRKRRTRRRAVGGAVVAACVAGGGLYYFGTQPDGGTGESTAVQAANDAFASDRPTPDGARSGSPSASPSASPKASASKSPRASASPTPRAGRTAVAAAPAKSSAPKRTASATPSVDEGSSDLATQVIALVNKERATAGCGPLTEDSLLRDAAQGHSDDMAARDFFDHTNPDGADPGRRITAAGYRWSTYGENIAKGQQTASSVMTSWMNSEGHRANILNCSFKNIGIGIHDGSGGPWWTQNFGAKL